MIKRTIFFLLLNFAALAIGGLFTGSGVSSEWYQNLNKAPWTPPGWVFGTVWTLIMILFAIYMAMLIKTEKKNNHTTLRHSMDLKCCMESHFLLFPSYYSWIDLYIIAHDSNRILIFSLLERYEH